MLVRRLAQKQHALQPHGGEDYVANHFSNQQPSSYLLRIPLSSASAERNFSSFSTIHTKKRNRLTTSRAEKLVYVYHNLRQLKKNECHANERNDTESTDEDIDNRYQDEEYHNELAEKEHTKSDNENPEEEAACQ